MHKPSRRLLIEMEKKVSKCKRVHLRRVAPSLRKTGTKVCNCSGRDAAACNRSWLDEQKLLVLASR